MKLNSDFKKCRHCKKMINKIEQKCPYCGEYFAENNFCQNGFFNGINIKNLLPLVFILIFILFCFKYSDEIKYLFSISINKKTSKTYIKEKTQIPDFSLYMKNMQKNIKNNWNPPKNNNSKRVTVLYSIDTDGNLKNLKVIKSSGDKKTDDAAIEAIQKTAPFEPLPVEYTDETVDIQFTFDYNIIRKNRF